jgi:hypothetical protein
MTWIFWGIAVLGVFLLVTWEYFVAGFSADASKITWLIVGGFVYGFILSLLVALHLQAEFKSLMAMEANQRIGNPNSSDVAAMFDSAMERLRRGDRIEVRNLVSAYGAKIKARVDNIGVISGMLITIGLLGTVVGLIITVTGLGNVLNANGADYAAMKAGLNQTVSGMGTAFYTTFFGALLGGVVLKVLGSEMKKSATQLVADTLRFSELFLAPQFTKASSEALANLESRVVVLDEQLNQLGGSLASVIDIIDSKQQALAAGLGDLLATVERTVAETNHLADARIGTLVEVVEQTSAKAEGHIGILVATVDKTVEETTRAANERLEAMAGAIEQSVAHTNRQADERLAALMERIGQMVDGTHAKADERLTALTETVDKTTEQTHRLADERLKAILETVDKASQHTCRETDERLSRLIETAGQSIDQTRREAEEQLAKKASDLSRKLGEAAAVLAALATPAETPED